MNWANLASFRVLIGALFAAAVIAALPALISGVLGTIVFVLALLAIYHNVLFNPRFQAYCPHCKRRVVLGADTCGRCGKAIA